MIRDPPCPKPFPTPESRAHGRPVLSCMTSRATRDRTPSPLTDVFASMRIHLIISECKVKVTQLCLSLCDPMDYTVHGILQARIVEWVALPFSRGSSQPSDRIQVSRIAGRFFTS